MQEISTTQPNIYYNDQISQWYNLHIQSSWIHRTAMPELLNLLQKNESIAGRTVCDLGCGSGIFSRQLARCRAIVVGVDISDQQLSYARRAEAEEPLGIRYIQADAQQFVWKEAPFHIVTSNLALIDIPDVEATAQTVARCLRPGGRFVFSIPHPCGPHTTGRMGAALNYRNYYAEGYWRSDNPKSIRGRVGSYHRTIETYVRTFLPYFVLEDLREPQAQNPIPTAYATVPSVFLMSWIKK